MRPEQLNNYKGKMDLADEKIKERKVEFSRLIEISLSLSFCAITVRSFVAWYNTNADIAPTNMITSF